VVAPLVSVTQLLRRSSAVTVVLAVEAATKVSPEHPAAMVDLADLMGYLVAVPLLDQVRGFPTLPLAAEVEERNGTSFLKVALVAMVVQRLNRSL